MSPAASAGRDRPGPDQSERGPGGPAGPPSSNTAALVAAAREARRSAYAPYSRFKVGAAVLAGGAVHRGCNVENASYGLTVCAERNAVGAAALAGARRLDAVAIASGTAPPTPPCGACLQVLVELGAPETPVLLAGPRGAPVRTTLGALLPQAFSKRYL